MTTVEVIFTYDLARGFYTVEFWKKQLQPVDALVLTICLPDGEKNGRGVPIVEGDRSAISVGEFDKAIADLRKWREETGDHLEFWTW